MHLDCARVSRRHALPATIALAGCAVIAVAGYRLRDTYVGDAAVYLPYARNAAHGHLFQFNVGEFSSGSTSPLWAVLLGIPYLLGGALHAAKEFSTAAAVAGFLVTVWAARHVSRSWTAASVASLFVLGTMVFYAASLYESGLVVALAAAALVAGARAIDGGMTPRSLAPLTAVWAALPLARPDAVVLVLAQAVAVFVAAGAPRRRPALALAGALAIAAVPAAIFFGYSAVDLGVPSTSSAARAVGLHESQHHRLGPLYLSGEAIKELFTSPWVFAFVPALCGLALLARDRPTRWLAVYGALAIAGYIALLTLVTPGLYDTPRYLLPIVPVVVAAAATAIARTRGTRLWIVALLAGLVVIGGTALGELRDRVNVARSIGITEAEVFETDVAALINQRAAPGDTVLSYEVQTRLPLRADLSVLSEDGITDGKVLPYQPRHDMTGFLLRYRPRWWIADQNAITRRYMSGSVLERALLTYTANPQPTARTIDGIRFELVARRSRPLAPGFGGWQMLFRLSYPARPARTAR